MEKISVTIITLNEEKNISDCLESVRWADEIIVSDSGSVDHTLAIVAKYTKNYYRDPWLGFAKQKNLCAERASNPWILNIDADERVSSSLQKEIQEALNVSEQADGYYLPRRNYFCGRWIKHGGWYPDYNLRLYKKDYGKFREREVHEAVVLKGKTCHMAGDLEHFTYDSVSDYLIRMDRYSTLAAQELAKSGKRTGLFKQVFHPSFTFFKMYFLQGAILDGYYGLLLSLLYSFYTFAKYTKLRELEHLS